MSCMSRSGKCNCNRCVVYGPPSKSKVDIEKTLDGFDLKQSILDSASIKELQDALDKKLRDESNRLIKRKEAVQKQLEELNTELEILDERILKNGK